MLLTDCVCGAAPGSPGLYSTRTQLHSYTVQVLGPEK